MEDRLLNLGFSERFINEAAAYPDFFLARVISQYKDVYKVATDRSEILAEISGKLRYSVEIQSEYPAVGDFVMIDRDNEESGNAIIHYILRRKSTFIRRAAGTTKEIQVVAANIDTVFICMSVNKDFNLRRLERYLSIAWNSGAMPVVVLTKSDLCPDIQTIFFQVEKIAVGADVVVTSSRLGDGYKVLLKYILPGITVAFIGSSGVGKSSLINCLTGKEMIQTMEIRKDDKGRHATTRRDLIVLPTGGSVIDTPGMREIGVESANLGKTFVEIEELADLCKFKDCRHENEPGCAVTKAIKDGIIDERRLISYKKLKKEAKYEELNSKQIEKEKTKEMYSDFGGVENAKKFIKSKNKSKH